MHLPLLLFPRHPSGRERVQLDGFLFLLIAVAADTMGCILAEVASRA
jgi:hypothetical protein